MITKSPVNQNGLLLASAAVALVLLFSCTDGSRSPEPDSEEAQVTQNENEAEEGLDSVFSDVTSEQIAIDFSVRLGYKRDELSVTDARIIPGSDVEMWVVLLEDEVGPLAEVGVNMNRGTVEKFKLSFPPKENDPPVVKAGEDLGPRIIDALGYDETEWRYARWMSDGNIQWEYRSYSTAGERRIATGRTFINADPRGGWLNSLIILDRDLMAEPEIQVSEEEAIAAAKSHLDAEDQAPVHVELIQLEQIKPGAVDYSVFWEIAFEDRVINVDAVTGEI